MHAFFEACGSAVQQRSLCMLSKPVKQCGNSFEKLAQQASRSPHPERHREAMRLEGCMHRMEALPSFETRIGSVTAR
jgi:hypothetical protein